MLHSSRMRKGGWQTLPPQRERLGNASSCARLVGGGRVSLQTSATRRYVVAGPVKRVQQSWYVFMTEACPGSCSYRLCCDGRSSVTRARTARCDRVAIFLRRRHEQAPPMKIRAAQLLKDVFGVAISMEIRRAKAALTSLNMAMIA